MFWIAALISSQLGIGRPAYVMPNGQECPTCPHSPCRVHISEALLMGHFGVTVENDCRACCQLTLQAEPVSKLSIQAPSTPSVEVAMLGEDWSIPQGTRNPLVPILTRIPGCPSTGPPLEQASRAPPCSLLL